MSNGPPSVVRNSDFCFGISRAQFRLAIVTGYLEESIDDTNPSNVRTKLRLPGLAGVWDGRIVSKWLINWKLRPIFMRTLFHVDRLACLSHDAVGGQIHD